MSKTESKNQFVIASDVSSRDGIGIEVYQNDQIVLEIFRDDTKKKREVTLYEKDVDLDLIEESIQMFKKEITWEFQD